jgi:hypothetical protein
VFVIGLAAAALLGVGWVLQQPPLDRTDPSCRPGDCSEN